MSYNATTMMKRLHKHWKRTPTHVRKPFVFLLGFAVVATGIVLLPLPGPGWLVIFAGFAILASEFEFAERVRDRLIAILKKIIAWGKQVWEKFVRALRSRPKG